jgi:hypothetical protein
MTDIKNIHYESPAIVETAKALGIDTPASFAIADEVIE